MGGYLIWPFVQFPTVAEERFNWKAPESST